MKPRKHKYPNTIKKFDQNIYVNETQQRGLDQTAKGFRDRLDVRFYILEHLESLLTNHIKM
jgi:hypothetical protein